jgi:hypothetical protein
VLAPVGIVHEDVGDGALVGDDVDDGLGLAGAQCRVPVRDETADRVAALLDRRTASPELEILGTQHGGLGEHRAHRGEGLGVAVPQQSHLAEPGDALVQLVGGGGHRLGDLADRGARGGQHGAIQRGIQLGWFAEVVHGRRPRVGARQVPAS